VQHHFCWVSGQGTLGRQIVDGAKIIKLFSEDIAVKAKIYTIGGLSAHADRLELIDWLAHFKTRPKRIFVVHGEEETSLEFAKAVHEKFLVDTYVPRLLEEVKL